MYDIDDLKNLVDMAAGGRSPADLLITNAKLVDVLTGEIRETDVSVGGGKILGFSHTEAVKVVDARGAYLLPGLIDAHIHIESSMVSPARFAGLVLPHGTTSVVADPHEIANVHGLEGIRYMLENGRHLLLNIFIALPPCPATPFAIPARSFPLKNWKSSSTTPKHRYGEMMNFRRRLRRLRRTGKIQLGTSTAKLWTDTPRIAWPGSRRLSRSPALRIPTSAPRLRRCARTSPGQLHPYTKAPPPRTSERSRSALRPATRRCAFCCDDRH
ncbi:MAG: amidohydrolase family protein [Bilophila wadsworthia]